MPLRPLSVGDTLDGTFRGLRATFLPVALLVLVLLGPIQLLLNLLIQQVFPTATTFGLEQFDDPAFDPETAFTFADIGAVLGGGALLGVLSWLATSVVTAAVVALVLQVDRGEDTDLGASVRAGLRVLGTVLLGGLAIGVMGFAAFLAVAALIALLFFVETVLGVVVLVLVLLTVAPIGFLAFAGASSLIAPIAIIEGPGVGRTLGRVWWVLRRRFWRLIGITVLILLVLTVVNIAVALPFGLLSFFLPGGQWIVDGVGETVAQVVTVPATALAAMLVYLDARIRLEGLDLRARYRDLGA
ncbi:MAG: hypothetical protein JJT89_07955 [Nitriliruptoraceae bacterium]|nr:hypothetical protein [Nitriliruptoraceae bacterium]